MGQKLRNASAVLNDPKARGIIIVLAFVALVAIAVSYIHLKRFGQKGAVAEAQLTKAPKISSIPGLGAPTREYVKLQETKNVEESTAALRAGTSSIPTLTRTTYLDSGALGQQLDKPDAGTTGCSTEDLQRAKTAGVSAAELRCRGCSMASLKDAGYNAGELMAAGFSAKQLKDAGFTAQDLKAAGFTAKELVAANFSTGELSQAGFTAAELKKAGVSAKELLANGFSPVQLRNAGFSAKELRTAGISITDLAKNGFSAAELKDGGFSDDDLKSAGFSQKTIDAIKNRNCNIEFLRKARTSGANAKEIRDSGCDATAMKTAGYTASELRDAGFTANDLQNAGVSMQELKAAGFSAQELRQAGISAKELRNAGFSTADLKSAGFSAGELAVAGASANELKNAEFNPADLKNAGFSAADLKDAGFLTQQLKNANFTDGDLVRAGFGGSALTNATTIAPPTVAAKSAASTPAQPAPTVAQSTAATPPADDASKVLASTTANATAKTEAAGAAATPVAPKALSAAQQKAQSAKELIAAIKAKETQSSDWQQKMDDLQKESETQMTPQQLQDKSKMTQQSMLSQANALFTSWGVTSNKQQFVAGTEEKKDSKSSNTRDSQSNDRTASVIEGNNIIYKAGDILFAVLNTGINSDEVSPIMATIVSGPLKGSKVIGTFTRTDQKVLLQFNTLSVPDLDRSLPLNAVAIDANTARTAMASDVDNHYLLRYGTIFASSFVSGLGQAIQTSGSSSQITDVGTQTNFFPELDTKQKFLVGLGNVGQQMSSNLAPIQNMPPTVTVNAGTSIGVLLMSDTQVPIPTKQ